MKSAIDILKDVNVSPNICWEALKKIFGDIHDWEPNTFSIELKRKGLDVSRSLMTKILAAQTAVVAIGSIVVDHEALFAFALACTGISHGYDEFAYPEVEAVCWAKYQLEYLTKKNFTDEEGFDPDEIDSSIAILFHNEGFYLLPDEYKYAQSILDNYSHVSSSIKKETEDEWKLLKNLTSKELKVKIEKLDHSVKSVQLERLANILLYIRDKIQLENQYKIDLNLTAIR